MSAGREVAGIGLSGQMHGLVVLDAPTRSSARRSSGTTSGRPPSASRSRSASGSERLIALTGNRALTGFTAPKLLWLRRHEPDAYARIARVMLPKDYVRLRLTGEWAIDASGRVRDAAARRRAPRWSDEVLEALELPRDWLPPVLESPDLAGRTGS